MNDQVSPQAQSASVQTAPLGAGAVPATQEVSQPSSGFAIPQEYADRGWAEKIKTPDDLFKAYDNAQSLIGKKAAAPAVDAPQEEWDRYYSALRPESPDKYDFGQLEGLPENFDATNLKATAAKLAYEIGLTPKQAKDLVQKYVATEMEGAKGIQAKLDKQFEELSKEHFGDGLADAQAATREAIEKYVPEGMRDAVLALQDQPAAMLAMAKIAAGYKSEIAKIKAEYGAEGKITGGVQASADGIDSVRNELAKLRTDKASNDPFSPTFNKNQERIKMLSEQVDRFYNRK
jgi:hypothetical protein